MRILVKTVVLSQPQSYRFRIFAIQFSYFVSLYKLLTMSNLDQIKTFVGQKHIAIAGVSGTPHKFGNAIFKELNKKGYTLYPISKSLQEFEGISCFPDIQSIPNEVTALIICTKPEQSKLLVQEARAKGIRNIWLQQGAEDKAKPETAASANENLITNQCILMYVEPSHFMHRTHAFINKLVGKYPH